MDIERGYFMKKKRNIKKLLITMIAIILGIGTTSSFAVEDHQGNDALTLSLSYFRYANGDYQDGYALNTVGNEGESHHPVYQIMNETKPIKADTTIISLLTKYFPYNK